MTWKPFLAAFLLISLAVQSLNRVVIVGGYYASAYVKNCENKLKPQLKCGGRCQMMKKLKAEDQKDQQAPVNGKSEQVLSSKSFFASLIFLEKGNIKHHAKYLLPPLAGFTRNYFHPPGEQLSILS